MLHRTIMTVLCLLLSFTSVRAEVHLAPSHFTLNKSPGYCMWCCLRMAGLHAGISRLDTAVTDREKLSYDWVWHNNQWSKVSSSGGYTQTVERYLKTKKVEYWIQPEKSTYSTEWLKWAHANDQPVVVGMLNYPDQGGYHAVVVTSFTDKEVKFVDPNDDKYIYGMTPAQFKTHWDGFCLIFKPDVSPTLPSLVQTVSHQGTTPSLDNLPSLK